MIKFPHNGRIIECSSAAEAVAFLKLIDADPSGVTRAVESPWTTELFLKFTKSLGDSRKKALGLLVGKHRVADEELRKELGLETNQALAGVLSGISKQAVPLEISARSVFTIDDERKAGKLKKTYVVSKDFLRTANEMNWPNE
jgi:hypothetical protein